MTEGNGVRPTGVLTPLRRNRFFYGKLMDTRHWELEQEYGIQSRRLVNQLGLGAGILCGLGVQIGDGGVVNISPGVAVDECGREIVVTETVSIKRVDQPTDDCAQPVGDPVRNGYVTLWLCYRECGSEYTRLANGDCGHRDQCVPGLLDERFAIRIGTDLPARTPGLSVDECSSIFPAGGDGPPQRQVIAGMLAGPYADPAECCIALATVQLDDAGTAIAVGLDYRPTLYSNEELFDLLLCLAARVESCCRQPTPTPLPPRVMGVWPPPKGEISEDDLRAFLEENRLELVFEREMRDLGLDKPDSWLGVWQVSGDGAARLPLTRAGGAFAHVTPQAGQEAVAYDVGIDQERNTADLAFVVMMRAAPGGDIVASDDGDALDADFTGTGLTDAERDELWKLPPDRTVQPVAMRDRVMLPAVPSLPSGDGVQGGNFHGVAARTKVVEVLSPPQLLRVAPAGGVTYDTRDPETGDTAKRFLDSQIMEVTISRAIADEGLRRLDGWLRVFRTNRDGAIYGFNPVRANTEGVTPNEDGSVTITIRLDPDGLQGSQVELLVVIRPGAAAPAAEPTGVDDPKDLLDADFDGTSLDKQTVITIFDGGPTNPIPNLDPVPTAGQALFDGAPGGLAHHSFTVLNLQVN